MDIKKSDRPFLQNLIDNMDVDFNNKVAKASKELLLSKKDAITFWKSIENPTEPNKALREAKKTADKLLKRRYD